MRMCDSIEEANSPRRTTLKNTSVIDLDTDKTVVVDGEFKIIGVDEEGRQIVSEVDDSKLYRVKK